MPKKAQRVHEVAFANYQQFCAVWHVGGPYIDVYGSGVNVDKLRATVERGHAYHEANAIHAINTNGDLGEDGRPKDGREPNEYVRDELKMWVDEDGETYRAELF